MNNNQLHRYHVHTIGSVANETLMHAKLATVMGITSRGIFLKIGDNQIVFLSFENFRGPMTLNVEGQPPALDKRSMGGLVQISPGLITILEANLTISTQGATIWQPETASPVIFQHAECLIRIKNFAQEAHQHKQGAGLSGLLPSLLSAPFVGFPSNQHTQDVWDTDIQTIRQGLFRFDVPATIKITENILGRGAGLTPSGDDFLIGLLLALNRWEAVFGPNDQLQNLNEKIISVAYTKTTTLSANLIECAARGLADERLINALDYLMTGANAAENTLSELLNWGNSSGVDALVGMIVAVLSRLSQPRSSFTDRK